MKAQTMQRRTLAEIIRDIKMLEVRDQALKLLTDRAIMLNKVAGLVNGDYLILPDYSFDGVAATNDDRDAASELMYRLIGAASKGHAATAGLARDLITELTAVIRAGEGEAASELGRVMNVLAHRRRDLRDWIGFAYTYDKDRVPIFTTLMRTVSRDGDDLTEQDDATG